LLAKELVLPVSANRGLFLVAPLQALAFTLPCWAVMPFGSSQLLLDLDIAIVFVYATTALSAYAILLAG